MAEGVYELTEQESDLLHNMSCAIKHALKIVDRAKCSGQMDYKDIRQLHIDICALIMGAESIESLHPDFAYIKDDSTEWHDGNFGH